MKNASTALLPVICALLLSACAAGTIKTSGKAEAGLPLEKMSASFNSTLPTQVLFTKRTGGFPAVTTAEKAKASDSARQIAALFARQLRNEFPRIAGQRGLVIVAPGNSVPHLNLSIGSIKTECSALGCGTMLQVDGLMAPFGGRTRQWFFSIDAGQSGIEAPIDNDVFKAFAEELLDALAKDGLLVKR
jgi:hypothetical protein